MASSPPDEVDDDLDEVLDLEPRSRSGGRRRGSRSRDPEDRGPLRRWLARGEGEEAWDDVVDDSGPKRRRGKPPVFWRARDSLYFEPLVALSIIVILLVSLFAYTSNWPPVYVVESNSMQHGPGDHLGDLNAGDIVLAQKAGLSSIVTYVEAIRTGYGTYGSYGDVILYYPNGTNSATPVVHRPIIYLQYDGRNDTYNATGLDPSECGTGAPYVYDTPGSAGNCATTYLTVHDSLNLWNIGGRTISVTLCPISLGTHSGFLTLGDNNSQFDQYATVCGLPPFISTLVDPSWVIGVARGMIPWFGALKLLLDGNAGKVPTASWEYLGLTISGVIFAAVGIHFLVRRRTGRSRRRRWSEDEDEEGGEAPRPAPRSEGAVKPWKPPTGPPEPAEKGDARPPARMSHEQRRRSHFASSRESRSSRRHGPGSRPSKDDDRSDPDDPEGGRSRL